MEPIATLQDSALIERTLAGQPEYFAVLMNRHVGAVRKRVKSMVRNSSDEDDIVQETFLKAWRHLSSLRSEASFRTWITRVATNEVLQQYRSSKSRPTAAPPVGFDNFPSNEKSPHEALFRAEAGATIRAAVSQLPPKYRQILTLCDLHELSAREAARWLGFDITLVKTRLFRARRMLSTAIHKRIDRPTPSRYSAACAA